MSNLLIAIIVVVVIIVVGAGIGLGVYFTQTTRSKTTESDADVPSTPVVAVTLETPTSKVEIPAASVTSSEDAVNKLMASPPRVGASGATTTFVPATPDIIPKTKSGKPAPAPKGAAWVGQKITSSSGKTVTIPMLVGTKPAKQVIITKDLNGKPLPNPPKGMVWVKKTTTKKGKTMSVVALEKKV